MSTWFDSKSLQFSERVPVRQAVLVSDQTDGEECRSREGLRERPEGRPPPLLRSHTPGRQRVDGGRSSIHKSTIEATTIKYSSVIKVDDTDPCPMSQGV